MGEPKTIRECADDADCEGNVVFDGDNPILDAHIIPGANAMVTPQGLDAAAEELRERVADKDVTLNYPWSDLDSHQRGYWRQDVRAALAAAGIVCVDEVASLRQPSGRKVDANGDLPICLDPGDTLYIKRCHSKSQ